VVLGISEWSRSGEPPTVFDMTAAGAWDQLIGQYAHRGAGRPLNRIFEIARAHGVVCIVKEPRYIDADWRSQLARFYDGAFRRYPSVCHRLHFFTQRVDPDLSDLAELQGAYRGYTILRPLPVAPVGRTMIVPPPELAHATRCEAEEHVDLFGWPFSVTAMPFISQDTQLLRCAHAALWMVLRHCTIVHGLPRQLPADIHDAALGGVIVGRQLPSDGLSAYQLISAMSALGLSPTGKALPQTAADEAGAGLLRLYGMVCRYINSRLPPVIISKTHAWVVVAYRRTPSSGNPVIQLWRHDDARGPYLPVDDPWNEPEPAHQPWVSAYLPLLPKACLDAERAEAVGRSWTDIFRNSPLYKETTLEEADNRPDSLEQSTLRTFLLESTRFKQTLAARGVPEPLAGLLRRTPMSRYIWIIEAADRRERSAGMPDVLGEVVLDATLTQFEPLDDPAAILMLHIDSFAFVSGIDGAPSRSVPLESGIRYRTACPPIP
jgi:hypothetical protein